MTTSQLYAKQEQGSAADVAHDRLNRWLLALVLLGGGCLAYLPYGLANVTPDRVQLALWITIAAGFGAAALAARGSDRYQGAWPPLFAFFAGSASQLIDWELSGWLPRLVGIPIESPAGLALDKLESSLLLVVCIIGFVLLAGDNLKSLYLQRGKVRWWLPIGLATFLLFLLMPLTAAQYLFGTGPLPLSAIVPALPWVLIFVLANGLAEELLFRGLLLPRLTPLVGVAPAVLVVSVVFTLWHLSASYAASLPIFLATVMVLAISWAVLTIKTDSLWGAVLFHAGADIPIVLALLASL
jgi:membrane protease YdiL (CAAX protease family)